MFQRHYRCEKINLQVYFFEVCKSTIARTIDGFNWFFKQAKFTLEARNSLLMSKIGLFGRINI